MKSMFIVKTTTESQVGWDLYAKDILSAQGCGNSIFTYILFPIQYKDKFKLTMDKLIKYYCI